MHFKEINLVIMIKEVGRLVDQRVVWLVLVEKLLFIA